MISPDVKQWCERARKLIHALHKIQNEITKMSDEYEFMRDEYSGDDDKERIDQCYAAMFNARNTFVKSNIMSGGSRTRRTRRHRRS